MLRLKTHRALALRFLHILAAPFTNNEAERDVRMMKLRQKTSGGFRTQEAAENCATLRTLIGTARKRGWNLLATLARPSSHLTQALGTG